MATPTHGAQRAQNINFKTDYKQDKSSKRINTEPLSMKVKMKEQNYFQKTPSTFQPYTIKDYEVFKSKHDHKHLGGQGPHVHSEEFKQK